MLLGIATAALLLGPSAGAARAAVTVTPTRPDDPTSSGVGMCATAGAPCSLREAINYVQGNGGGTVDLTGSASAVTYTLDKGPLAITAAGTSPVAIAGPSPRTVTISDKGATTASNLFTVAAGSVLTIGGVTISDGQNTGGPTATATGGAIENAGTLTLNNDALVNNTVTAGVLGSAHGGAIDNATGATLTLSNSTLSANTAASGNGTGATGGAIANAGTLNVTNATITGNSAGGMGQNAGGGIAQSAGTTVLANVTLTGNTAASSLPVPSASGGNLSVAGSVQAKDTIIAAGAANAGSENCSATITSLGYNIEDKNQCGLTATGDQVSTDPQLGKLGPSGGNNATDTEQPAPTSPAVDHGNPAGCSDALGHALATDQVANPRGTPCDVGAYELILPPVVVTGPTISGTPQTQHQLTCGGASFGGLAPIAQTFAWQRDGIAIAGAASATYTPVGADIGHGVSCSVTGTNVDGSATAVSAAVKVSLPPLPPFDGVTLLNPHLTLRNGQVLLNVHCSNVAVFGCAALIRITVAGSVVATAARTDARSAAKKKKKKKKRRAPRVPHPATLGTGQLKFYNNQTGLVSVLISHDGKLEIQSRPHGRQPVDIAILAYDGLGRPKLTTYRGDITAVVAKKKSAKRRKRRH